MPAESFHYVNLTFARQKSFFHFSCALFCVEKRKKELLHGGKTCPFEVKFHLSIEVLILGRSVKKRVEKISKNEIQNNVKF